MTQGVEDMAAPVVSGRSEKSRLIRLFDRIADFFALLMSGFAIYVAAFGVFDNVIVSGLTVLLALIYGFFAWRGTESAPAKTWMIVLHGLMAVAITALILDWGRLMFEQEEFFIEISVLDNGLGWVAFATLGYLTFRLFGLSRNRAESDTRLR